MTGAVIEVDGGLHLNYLKSYPALKDYVFRTMRFKPDRESLDCSPAASSE